MLRKIIDRYFSHLPQNFHIIQDLSIREWILASDLVMSSHSTSLIEAAIADKPVYMIDPVFLPSSLQVDWYKYLKRIKTREELLNICSKALDSSSGKRLKVWAKKTFLAHGDSILNLANYIGEICKNLKYLQENNAEVIQFEANLYKISMKIRQLLLTIKNMFISRN